MQWSVEGMFVALGATYFCQSYQMTYKAFKVLHNKLAASIKHTVRKFSEQEECLKQRKNKSFKSVESAASSQQNYGNNGLVSMYTKAFYWWRSL
jgi:hypothetical protein